MWAERRHADWVGICLNRRQTSAAILPTPTSFVIPVDLDYHEILPCSGGSHGRFHGSDSSVGPFWSARADYIHSFEENVQLPGSTLAVFPVDFPLGLWFFGAVLLPPELPSATRRLFPNWL